MNRLELLVLQIFAVGCTYLLLSIPVASALHVGIFLTGGDEVTTSMLDFSDFVNSEFVDEYQQNYQYMEIKFSSKNPSYDIKKIYLFRCKALDPSECIQNGIEPVISVNEGTGSISFDETYRWDDISSDNIGNFLTFAKLDISGKEVWIGSWNKITKTGIKNFYHEIHNADKLNIYLNDGVAAETVRDYIENYNAIPSDNVDHSVIETVSGSSVTKIHDLAGNDGEIDPSGTTVPLFHPTSVDENTFTESLRTWDFIFAGNGKISSPITFYSTEAGPPTSGGATIVAETWSPQVVTCGSDDVITVRLHVENASNIGNYQSYYYKIDGVQSTEGSIICTIDTENSDDNTYYYDCTIPVVNFPVCNGPGTSTISVNFNYLGGVKLSGSFPITLVPATPKLIVNSLLPAPFDCGIDSEVTIQLQVNDPISQAPETYYTFDNTNFNDLDCTSSGHTYSCTIDGDEVCSLLQEHLEVTVKFTYGEIETLAQPAPVFVTFPPPSMGIDTVTPQTVEAGETTDVSVLLHVNYPDTITFQEDDFNYKYLSNSFSAATCTLESSYSNIKYYKCTVPLVIPSTSDGVNDLSFRLDGFMEGAPKQLTAKTFFEIMPPPPEPAFTITSTSSPVDCVTDSSAEVRIKAENIDLLSVSDFKYTIDGTTYIDNECTKSSNILTCTITAAELCDTMKNLVIIKYSIDDTYYTNSQKIYLQIPDPHMQVYAVQPDTLSSGEVNSVNIKLFVQHPEMVGTSPSFLYNYASKSDQPLTCVKVSSTANRDFYECANTQFDLTSYSASSLSVLFSIQGSLVTFPMVIPVADVADTNPWLEIVSTTPSRIETELGNQTSASLYVTVHNAMAADLKHQATVIPNSILSAGTCTEADVEYDFNCDVTIRMPANADPGANSVTLSLRMSNGKNYDFSNTTNVYAISDDTQLEIQSISPDNLYCGGQTQQNQNTVRVTARSKILTDFEIIEEVISFNGRTIPGSSRYCTAKGQAITCNIPTDKLMAAVTCDSGDLAPGEGSHFYTFDLTLLVKAGGNSEMLSGFGDISVTARPLEPYLEILDNDVVSGALQSPINCLIGQSIKLGDSGYVRIMYADLLHPEPKEDDLMWSFRLDAQDDQGKLTKGMGVSPTGNSTICKLINHQKVGVHRIEDYQCSLYTSVAMFQRCEYGEGQIILTATAAGKKAEGIIDTRIVRDDSKYQIDMDILTSPEKTIECQIQGVYGKGVKCSLASSSNQNITIRLYNANPDVELSDINLYDFDVLLTNSGVLEPRTLGNCRKSAKEGHKYICPFQIGPTMKLPDTDKYEVTNDSTQTFDPISLGQVNLTVYVKYANGLAKKTISKLDGSMTIQPKKSDAMINAEKMMADMMEKFNSFKDFFKWIVLFLAYCGVCSIGNKLITSLDNAADKKSGCDTKTATENVKTDDKDHDCNAACKETGRDGGFCLDSCDQEDQLEFDCGTGNKCCCFKPDDKKDESQDETVKTCSELCSEDGYTISKCLVGTCADWIAGPANLDKIIDKKEVSGCISNQCCCYSGSASNSPQSSTDYQIETTKIGFDGDEDTTNGDGDNGDTGEKTTTTSGAECEGGWGWLLKVVVGAAAAVGLYISIKEIFNLGVDDLDEGEEKDELTEYLEKGLAWGFATCVMPRIIGEMFSGEEKKNVFNGIASVGKTAGNVCDDLFKLMPHLMALIEFYISYMQFEMCMEMVQQQVKTTAYATSQLDDANQWKSGTQSSAALMTNMMGCFSTFTRSMSRLTNTLVSMEAILGNIGSGGYTSIVYYHNGIEIQEKDIYGPGTFKVRGRNLCKSNSGATRIRITKCDGKRQIDDSSPCPGNINEEYNLNDCAEGDSFNVYISGTKSGIRNQNFIYHDSKKLV